MLKRIFFLTPEENLTGQIQGQNASDIEERTARAIDKLPEWDYTFQVALNPITGYLSPEKTHLVGEVEIDFLLKRGNELKAILVDGEIGHFYAAWQKVADEAKTEKVNDFMKKINQGEAKRVEFWWLADQEAADRYYRQLLV